MKVTLNITLSTLLSIGTLCAHPLSTYDHEDYLHAIAASEEAPVAAFETNSQILPAAGSVQFLDLSTNSPEAWEWIFEGGIPETSTEQFPTVEYPSEGIYNVQLIVSNAFGSDTLLLEDYISVVGTVTMCNETSSTASSGVLYDSGGPNGDYGDDESCSFLISPECANSITLSFSEFELWWSGDSISVYDGNDASGDLLFIATGNSMPEDFTAFSGEMFIRFTSNGSIERDGWVAAWTSELSAGEPTATIVLSDVNPPIDQAIQFTDASTEFPSSRLWDFGDGTTSTDQNPSHVYTSPGTYEVTLSVENCFGTDTTSVEIVVQETPTVELAPIDSLALSLNCGSSLDTTFYIINSGSGDLVVNSSNSIDFASDSVNILAHTLFVYDQAYENAINAISADFAMFNLFETQVHFPNQLDPVLEDIDIVLIPPNYDASILFSITSESLTGFVENGGKLLICGNPDLQNSPFFPFAGEDYLPGGTFEIIDLSHPTVDGVAPTFSDENTYYTYDWAEDSEISSIAINSEMPDYYAVAELDFGQGKVVYHGSRLFEPNENSERLLANAIKYLAEFSEGGIIQTLSLAEQEVIHPGDSLQVNLSLSAAGIFPGTYTDTLFLETNDPDNAALTYLISMEVSGEPVPDLNADEIIFTPILNGETITDTLVVYNQGCESFDVEASLETGFFSLSVTDFSLEAFSSDTIFVTYAPTASGAHSEVIEILTTAGNFSVPLSGFADESATINVTPENQLIDVAACADSVLVIHEVANDGEALLQFNRGPGGTRSLDEILLNLNANHGFITDQIPDIYLFSEGFWENKIMNGGPNMYDYGNYLNTNFEEGIQYTGGDIDETGYFGEESRYFTRKRPGLFVMAADLNAVDFFSITGTLDTDGMGSKQGGELEYSFAGRNYKGFYTNTIGTGGSSINHLIIAEDSPALGHSFLTTTETEEHTVSGLSETNRLYYLLFSANELSPVQEETTQAVFETFIKRCVAVPGFAVDTVYEVEPGESVEIETYLQVAGLAAGSYDFSVEFTSNAPGGVQFDVPVTVEIDDAPCAFFEASVDLYNCTGLVEFESQSTNEPETYHWDFGDGFISTQENPSHLYAAPGVYTVQLTVCSGGECDSTQQVFDLISEFGPVPAACQPTGGTGFLGFSFVSIEINDDMAFNIQEQTEYIDLSCGILSNIKAGEENTYRIWFSCYTNLAYVKAQIDYNNDGVYTDDESIFDGTKSTLQGFSYVNIESTFTAPGTAVFNYPLRYRVTIDDEPIDDCQTDDGRTRDFSVLVSPPTEAPISSFAVDAIDECQREFQFFDESANAPNAWSWDFGDGNTSTLQNPIHTFEEAGEYNVTLEAANDIGLSVLSFIVDAPLSGFTTLEATGDLVSGEPILFSGVFEGDGILNWDFGDGTTLQTDLPQVEHTYAVDGIYEVSVSSSADVCNPESTISVNIGSLSATGSDELDFLIYPNPSNGDFVIETPDGVRLVDVAMYDALGRRVSVDQFTIHDRQVRLSITNPEPGMYLLLLTGSEGDVHHSRVILK